MKRQLFCLALLLASTTCNASYLDDTYTPAQIEGFIADYTKEINQRQSSRAVLTKMLGEAEGSLNKEAFLDGGSITPEEYQNYLHSLKKGINYDNDAISKDMEMIEGLLQQLKFYNAGGQSDLIKP